MNEHEPKLVLAELFTGSELRELREKTLERGLVSMRRRRQRRIAAQVSLMAALPLVILAGLQAFNSNPFRNRPAPPLLADATHTAAALGAPGIKTITDDELFALFPGRPMALIGKPGHQQLLFLDVAIPARARFP